MKNNLFYTLLFFICLCISACEEKVEPDPEPEIDPIDESITTVNQWVYDILDEVYLWEEQLPRQYDPMVQKNSEDYFYAMLSDEDHWSYITSNYDELSGELDGVYKTFGFNYQFFYKDDTQTDIVAIVNYVLPNSPADEAGIERGNMISVVDGVTMTTENYTSALSNDIAEVELLKWNTTEEAYEALKTVSLTKEVVEEDPIFLAKTIDLNGSKVGYLVYNSFVWTPEDSTNLANTFLEFKANNIDELILDFRYNGGGSNAAAIFLSSMIAPSQIVANEEVLTYNEYNDLYTNYFQEEVPEQLEDRFTSDVPVNLDLNKVYVLTLGGTASASELVTIGLEPYMDVVQIGQNTYGKFTSMWLLDDQNKGKTHSWGMLPVIAKYSNAVHFTDFVDGLEPDFFENDGYQFALGDENEWLLNVALEYIEYGSIAANKSLKQLPYKKSIGRQQGGNPILKEGVLYKKWSK